jgi:hypothetical protein
MSFGLKITQGNLTIGSDGDLEKIIDTDKLVQDILQIVLPILYSSTTDNLISEELIHSSIQTTVSQALETLQKMQATQSNFQILSPAEQLMAIRPVLLERNPIDPRYLEVAISVISRALTPVSTGFALQL